MIKAKNPAFKARVEEKIGGQHFMRHIGFEIHSIEEGRVKGSILIAKHIQQQDGYIHGGAIGTFADIVAGFAAYTLVDVNERVVTAEIKTSYYRPAVGERLEAIGWVDKAGHHFHFCESEIWCIKGEKRTLVAKATTTMAVIKDI